MQFVSQVACSLDMTCFSTAYGFSCYRAYLTNSKNRSSQAQLSRLLRSVGLIIAGAILCNFSFEMAVMKNAITLETFRKILTFETLYWDYINTVQKYAILREILMPQRTSLLTTNDPICCICMTETVVIVFTPCGHTFCTNCSKRSVVCHICRQMVTNRVRIYFG